MGADIRSFAEVRKNGKWLKVTEPIFSEGAEPFGWRSYALFGFLAGIRNYSHCKPLSEPKGLPEDSEYLNAFTRDEGWGGITQEKEYWRDEFYGQSYITLKEFLDFDYDQTFWDRRISRTKQLPGGGIGTDDACLAEEGEGEIITYREHLSGYFF